MAMIIDGTGNEKATGDIDRTDMVKVVAADGKTIVYYTFGTLVNSNVLETNDFSVYPNPTSDKLNVTGLERGNKIQLYNSVGVVVFESDAKANQETISMESLPSGMYLIIVRDDITVLSRNKIIKK
jgi:hypothetical protein